MTRWTSGYSRECGEAAAAAIVNARASGARLGPLPPEIRPRDLDDAYLVQHVAHRLLRASGFGRIGGWKIGCTTAVMQEYLGVEAPVAGAMLRSSMWHGGHRFVVAPPRVLGVECEIAVRVGRHLDRRDRPYSVDEVADAVAASMAAIEVVEDRYFDHLSMDAPTLVADDFYHHASVVGEENDSVDPRSLKHLTSAMTINGEMVGHGRGSDILGDPLEALAWLANALSERGVPLMNGDVVSLGSMVKTQWVDAGDVVVVSNDLLGEVGATFVSAR